MPRPFLSIAAASAVAAIGGPASAHIADGWPTIARTVDEERGCALAVSGNGQAYRIAATGYAPAARARLFLANADMTPIDRAVRLDGAGNWSDYYLPFLWHHDGGIVTVSVVSPACSLTVDFPWTRAGPVTR